MRYLSFVILLVLASSLAYAQLPLPVERFWANNQSNLNGFTVTYQSPEQTDLINGGKIVKVHTVQNQVWFVERYLPKETFQSEEAANHIIASTGLFVDKAVWLKTFITEGIRNSGGQEGILVRIQDPTGKHEISISWYGYEYLLLIYGKKPQLPQVFIDWTNQSPQEYSMNVFKVIVVLDAEKTSLEGLTSCFDRRLLKVGLPDRLPKRVKSCVIDKHQGKIRITVTPFDEEPIVLNY